MQSVHLSPVVSAVGVGALLGATAATVGLSALGWILGLAYGLAAATLLDRALVRRRRTVIGAADWVTLTRMVLIGGVVALGADYPPTPTAPLVLLVALALSLDALDGAVARRTGTASEFGARFDMEVDAFLILVLSVMAAEVVGAWVILIGVARYAFVIASWAAGWMRRPLPPRYWRKVVAAAQGIALLVVISGVLPAPMSAMVAAGALALLIESFGHDILWLWRQRQGPLPVTAAAQSRGAPAYRPAP
jgi:phosphatidylglycerophosphate synthase